MELTKEDILLAQTGRRTLRETIAKIPAKTTARLTVGAGNPAEINLPPQAVKALTEVLEHLANGEEVTVTSKPVEMTTQQAADFLRVSRPFFVGLLENGKIPFHKTGTHRRIRFDDLQAYKERIDAQRLITLEELTKQAQELNMGY